MFDILLHPPAKNEHSLKTGKTLHVKIYFCKEDNDKKNHKVEFKRLIGRKQIKSLESKTESKAKKIKVVETILLAQLERKQHLKEPRKLFLLTPTPDISDLNVNEYMHVNQNQNDYSD